MSININDIYCNHYLKTSELVDYCKSPNYKSFKYPEFPLLTSFHVKDTIHYNALVNNDYKTYDTYIKDTEQKEHSLISFHNLRDNFTIDKIKKIKSSIDVLSLTATPNLKILSLSLAGK